MEAAFITVRDSSNHWFMFFALQIVLQRSRHDDHLFRGLISKRQVVIYMDDILIFTATIEEHRQIVQEVLQIFSSE